MDMLFGKLTWDAIPFHEPVAMGGVMGMVIAGLAVLIACLGLFGLAVFTAERRIKEGKNAVKSTRLSCRRHKDNQARFQLFALA